MTDPIEIAHTAVRLYAEGGVMTESGTPQYYYRDNRCQAKTALDAGCICWHDEGTGPFPDERPDDPVTLKEWRSKPHNVEVSGDVPGAAVIHGKALRSLTEAKG